MKLLTVDEAAERLALSPTALRQRMYRKQIPVVRLGSSVRLREDVIDDIVENGFRDDAQPAETE